jgi:hypothetical protein
VVQKGDSYCFRLGFKVADGKGEEKKKKKKGKRKKEKGVVVGKLVS